LRQPLDADVSEKLRKALLDCPDLSFAHLVEVEVSGSGDGPGRVLFVWLDPAAMKSMRAALNLVSDAVARALPRDQFLDVVILNSAPELLTQIERAESPFVELDPEERRRALVAGGLETDISLP
jgi:hypothetical protein